MRTIRQNKAPANQNDSQVQTSESKSTKRKLKRKYMRKKIKNQDTLTINQKRKAKPRKMQQKSDLKELKKQDFSKKLGIGSKPDRHGQNLQEQALASLQQV